MNKDKKSQVSWKELYKLALLETDRNRLSARLAEAHAAISLHLNSLASSTSSGEYTALKEAQRFLWLVEKEELRRKNFP